MTDIQPAGTIVYITQLGDTPERIEEYIAQQYGVSVEMLRQALWSNGFLSAISWLSPDGSQLLTYPTSGIVLSEAGQTIFIPDPQQIPDDALTPEERERALQGAIALVDEQEAGRKNPLTQEDVNKLLAEIATAEHYARMMELASNPQNLISDELLLSGQGLPDNLVEDTRRQWMIRHLAASEQNPAFGGYIAWSGLVAAGVIDITAWSQYSNEELEERMKHEILIPRIRNLMREIWVIALGTGGTGHPPAIYTEVENTNLETLSIEELVDLGIRLEEAPETSPGRGTLFNEYYTDVDEARIEELLKDWNQIEERLLLDELSAAIGAIPPSIWVFPIDSTIAEVTDFYGRMEARHQLLSEIVAPRQAQEAVDQQRLQDKRDLYLEYINIGVEEGLLEERNWENQSYRTLYDAAHEVARDQRYFHSFLERYAEIEYGDPYKSLRGAGMTALFILSLIPVVGTAADIVDGLIQLSQGNVIGAGLAFLGPLGEAISPIRALVDTGGGASRRIMQYSNEAINTADNVVRQAQDNVGVVDELSKTADDMAERIRVLNSITPSALDSLNTEQIRNPWTTGLPPGGGDITDWASQYTRDEFERLLVGRNWLQQPFYERTGRVLSGEWHLVELGVFYRVRLDAQGNEILEVLYASEGITYVYRRVDGSIQPKYQLALPSSVDIVGTRSTHSHPQGGTFSDADVIQAVQQSLRDIQAIDARPSQTYAGFIEIPKYILEPTPTTFNNLISLVPEDREHIVHNLRLMIPDTDAMGAEQADIFWRQFFGPPNAPNQIPIRYYNTTTLYDYDTINLSYRYITTP